MAQPPVAHELLQVVARLSLARTMEAIAEVIRTSARTLSGADGVTFVLRDGDYCFYADEDAIGPLWKGRRFPIETCISGWVMMNRQPVLVPDIYKDARIPHGAYRPTFVKSLAMAPIRREDPVGAIGAYWAAVNKPGPAELEIIQSLAEASALAVANVGLYGELQATIESERRARRAAEEASRLKDEFLATVSHELRTPLHVMRGWLWQLRQSTVSPEILRRGLEVVARNAELQAGMVEDLLDTSRAMAGDLKLDSVPVDFAAVCRTVVEAAQPAAAAAGLSLTLSADGAATVNGDAGRLAQIVSNIVSNSMKFGFPGGRIDVAIRRLDDGIRLEVHDDGCGIDPEFLPHVFDPFRQAETGTTRRHGGLGLGLALVRQFTQMHGGTVHVISEGKGRGTTVVVDLPATSAPMHGSEAEASTEIDSRPAIAH